MTTELNQTNSEWGDAHLLALRNQMADAGLVVQTVAEGVAFLLKLFEAQGEIKRKNEKALINRIV